MTEKLRWWEDRCSAAGVSRIFCYLDRWHDEVTEPPDEEYDQPFTYLVGKPWTKWLCWLHDNTVSAECWVKFKIDDIKEWITEDHQ